MRRFLFIICLCASAACARRYTKHLEPRCPPALAQTRYVEDRSTSFAISGVVLDRDTGRPVMGAYIRVAAAGSQPVSSDSAGAFSLTGLASGRHVLTILRIGYERRIDTVTLGARRGVRSQIAVTPSYFDRCPELVEVRTPLPWWRLW